MYCIINSMLYVNSNYRELQTLEEPRDAKIES